MPVERIPHLVERIRQAFIETPDLRVTLTEAQRLWNMDELVAQHIFDALVATRFLIRSRDGVFMRAT